MSSAPRPSSASLREAPSPEGKAWGGRKGRKKGTSLAGGSFLLGIKFQVEIRNYRFGSSSKT